MCSTGHLAALQQALVPPASPHSNVNCAHTPCSSGDSTPPFTRPAPLQRPRSRFRPTPPPHPVSFWHAAPISFTSRNPTDPLCSPCTCTLLCLTNQLKPSPCSEGLAKPGTRPTPSCSHPVTHYARSPPTSPTPLCPLGASPAGMPPSIYPAPIAIAMPPDKHCPEAPFFWCLPPLLPDHPCMHCTRLNTSETDRKSVV